MDKSMLAKAAITTVIAALLAGGVVYYGMPNGTAQSGPAVVSDKSTSVKKSWIDKHLKENAQTGAVQKTKKSELQMPTISSENVAPDAAATPNAVAADAEDDTQSEEIPAFENETDEIGTEIEPRPIVQEPNQPEFEPIRFSKNATMRLEAAQEQIENIGQPELKDQALLDLVDFAVGNGMFGDAKNAVSGISQAELRDTARSRIANAYAMLGQPDEAFGLIEDVEVEALQDVMRLQAIQALIAPQRLPQSMQ